MKPNRLGVFDFLAGLRACGLAGLRACGLAGLRACGLAALAWLALASAAFAQTSLIKSEYPGPASQRTDVRSPNNKVETLGDSGCQTTIYGYEATSTQLIVKTTGQPRSCSFADLKFILNGKSYDLEGIDTNFFVNSRGSYVWKENPNANAWIWFNIGTRLPADALEKATGSLGVYEYACKSNQSCLTSSRINVAATEPLVAAAAGASLQTATSLQPTPSTGQGQCRYFDNFKDNNDGTVTDPRSGTVWQRCALGQRWNSSGCVGEGKGFPWWDAMRAAKADRSLDKSDWRLPTKNEVMSIVGEYGSCYKSFSLLNRAVSTVFQPVNSSGDLGNFWTASQTENKNSAYTVSFDRGYEGRASERGYPKAVRFVRTGQASAVNEFNRELSKIGQYEAADIAQTRKLEQETAANAQKLRDQAAANAANEARNKTQSAATQQRSGDYEFISQAPRNGEIATWVARCRSGGDAVVTKRDSASSVCFWRNNNAARCESIGVEAAVRKACAE